MENLLSNFSARSVLEAIALVVCFMGFGVTIWWMYKQRNNPYAFLGLLAGICMSLMMQKCGR